MLVPGGRIRILPIVGIRVPCIILRDLFVTGNAVGIAFPNLPFLVVPCQDLGVALIDIVCIIPDFILIISLFRYLIRDQRLPL